MTEQETNDYIDEAVANKVPQNVLINIATADVPNGIRLEGKAHFVLTVSGNHVTLNVDSKTEFERIENACLQSMAFCKSFSVTSADLGVKFVMFTKSADVPDEAVL